jgi:3-oxoacyl-[acyl-carrier protein] reductase
MKKKILIIGGTSGIMTSCIDKLLEKNYQIFASYNNEESLKNFSSKIRKNKDLIFFKLNFLDDEGEITKTLKNLNIEADIIINAVGGSFGIKDYPYDIKDWVKLLDLNILKHIFINNFFIKKMIKKKFGRILFFSTTAVDDKNASIAYSTSKAFLENYVVKSANIFGKHNILINCIKTSIIAAKNNNWYKASVQKPDFVKDFAKKYLSVERLGTGADLVNFINLIISEENNFMNGSIVRIDGGLKS